MPQTIHEDRFTPQPTRYNGVLFRSKSEAVFARNLDMAKFIWEYEPEFWTCNDGWKPDFWALKNRHSKHGILSIAIEYKPAPVTDAYRNRIAKRFSELGLAMRGSEGVIICGSPFDTSVSREVWEWDKSSEFNLIDAPIFFQFLDRAVSHRFDLA